LDEEDEKAYGLFPSSPLSTSSSQNEC